MIFVLISQSIYEGYSIEKVFQEKNLKLKTKIKRIHGDLQDRDKEKEREREIDRERERDRERDRERERERKTGALLPKDFVCV